MPKPPVVHFLSFFEKFSQKLSLSPSSPPTPPTQPSPSPTTLTSCSHFFFHPSLQPMYRPSRHSDSQSAAGHHWEAEEEEEEEEEVAVRGQLKACGSSWPAESCPRPITAPPSSFTPGKRTLSAKTQKLLSTFPPAFTSLIGSVPAPQCTVEEEGHPPSPLGLLGAPPPSSPSTQFPSISPLFVWILRQM